MTGTYEEGLEGTGAAPNSWRGVHVIETGFIRQFGYKQIRFSLAENGLWALSKTLDLVWAREELSLWSQALGALDALFARSENCDWDLDGGSWYLHVFPVSSDDAAAFGFVGSSPELYVAVGSNYAATVTPRTNRGYVFDYWKVDGVTVSPTGSITPLDYTFIAKPEGTHHCLVAFFKLGYVVTGGANVVQAGYNSVPSGSGFSWTANGSAGSGRHWHFYFDNIDVGHSGYVGVQANGSTHTCSCESMPN